VIRPRQSSAVLTAALLVGVVAVLYFARHILIPLALAITLTLILSPAVTWLRKLRVPRFAAALLVMLVSVSIAGSVGYVIFNQLLQVVNSYPVIAKTSITNLRQ
jgi:predicted PurR-regulated permease PerM